MRVRVLGSAAGGGLPQWNCNCPNCRGLRAGSIRATPRTQSSIAVSADGDRWSLMNASPDLRAQVVACPELAPPEGVRASAIAAVFLSDAEIDHVAGLLSLREHQALRLYCSPAVCEWVLRANPIFAALLGPARLVWNRVDDHSCEAVRAADGSPTGLTYEAFFVPGKIPAFVQPPVAQAGSTIGYRVADVATGRSIAYVPVIKHLTDAIVSILRRCDCVLLDGTFWSEDEMATHAATPRTASQMGHLPISGVAGSLARLRELQGIRKIYTHINNTNPIVDDGSCERRALVDAGWEVAEDGMELVL